MDTIEFKLRGEHIALCDLLKLTGVADSGVARGSEALELMNRHDSILL